MRILQIVLAPRLSGAEVLAKGIAISHQRSGHSGCIASLLPPQTDFAHIADELRTEGVTCLFPARSYHNLGRLLFLYNAIRRFKPDIIFAHSTLPALYVRALPTRVPIVWVMHSGANDFENKVLLRAERLFSRRAKAVIAVSQKNIDDYLKEIGPHPAMFVVPNGVDTTRFNGDDSTHATHRPPGKTKQIVQIGRYYEVKNQLDTVRAFRHAVSIEPDARLLMCGVIEDHAYHAAVTALVAELGLNDYVEIVGPQSNVAEILHGSRVFVMPSSFEAHSIGFLEALASGIPVVANAIPAFAFAVGFPSVRLIDTSNVEAYGHALVESLQQPRAGRSLTGLTLQDTANRYLAIALQLLDLPLAIN